jgi:hypothetical protein
MYIVYAYTHFVYIYIINYVQRTRRGFYHQYTNKYNIRRCSNEYIHTYIYIYTIDIIYIPQYTIPHPRAEIVSKYTLYGIDEGIHIIYNYIRLPYNI